MGRARLIVPFVMLAVSCRSGKHERAFVSETGSANVAVVDLVRGVVDKHIPTGFIPHNLVVAPDGTKLYVAAAGSQSVAQIDVASETLSATWLTSPVPERRPDGTVIEPHATQGAFTHTGCQDCHRDGGAKPRYVGNRPVALRLSPDGNRLYVCEINSGNVVVLDTTSGAQIAAANVAVEGLTEPSAIAILDDVLYVGVRATQPTRSPGVLRKLDATTLSLIGDIPFGSTDPVELVAVPERHVLLVTHFDSNKLSVVSDNGDVRSIVVANGPLGITPLADGRVLVLGYYSNAVSVVSLDTDEVETFALTYDGKPLSNPTHAALSADAHTAWVVQSGTSSSLVALDTRRKTVRRTIPLDGLSYDVAILPVPKRLTSE